MLNIQLDPKDKNKAISIYDPACGTGGMFSVATKIENLDQRSAIYDMGGIFDLLVDNIIRHAIY